MRDRQPKARGRRQPDAMHLLRAVVERSPSAVFIKDLEGRYLIVNAAAARVLGRPVSEVIGRRDLDLVDPEQVGLWRRMEHEAIRRDAPVRFDERVTMPDGTSRDFSTTFFPYHDQDGTLAGVAGIAYDLTDRLQAEGVRARLAAIVTASPDAIVSVDPATRIIQMWNPGAERLFGYTADEALGKPVSLLVPPDRMPETMTSFARILAGEALAPFESVRVGKSGRRIEVWVTLFGVKDEQGGLLNVSAIVRDLTELRRAQAEIALRTAELEQAAQLNHLKDHFLSTLSHEMKTPLSLIGGYAELLEERYPGDELLEGILEGTRRLNEHLTALLEYSALISGTLYLDRTEVDLAEVIAHVQAGIASRAQGRGLSLAVELDPETPHVRGDFRRLVQIVRGLVENALKVTPAGGALGIRVGPEAGEVRIDVWDTGPGIPERDFARIWEAFTQLETSDAMRKGGLGLGLTLVKQLTELHGGSVAVVSQPGRGATFTIRLPALPASQATSPETLGGSPTEKG